MKTRKRIVVLAYSSKIVSNIQRKLHEKLGALTKKTGTVSILSLSLSLSVCVCVFRFRFCFSPDLKIVNIKRKTHVLTLLYAT